MPHVQYETGDKVAPGYVGTGMGLWSRLAGGGVKVAVDKELSAREAEHHADALKKAQQRVAKEDAAYQERKALRKIARKARDDAKAAGATQFYGAPCKRGHSGLRWVGNSTCVECARPQDNASKARAYLKDPEKFKARQRGYYAAQGEQAA
jgi:hypothetical protein